MNDFVPAQIFFVPAQNMKRRETNYTRWLSYKNVTVGLYYSDTLRLIYAYFTAELCIRHGCVIIKLQLTYAYVTTEFIIFITL